MKAKAKRKTGRSTRKATSTKRARPKPRATKKAAKQAKKPKARKAGASRWVKFVEKHGIVLASAKGPVPNVAEAVAGEPIVGSWWAHAKGKAIFAALSEIDDSTDVRCFKLVDGKVTFAHRKVWPALVRLGKEGVISAEQLAAVQQEHMPTGEHRNIVTPFPDWVDDATAAAAEKLAADKARAQLAWIDASN
ncbi:MAG TPA: hypothetical protein VFV99_25880 [Kofleriaceae bacterium]|nr:hypothetical protein [Kofleriaceae bacterium]